MAFGRYLGGPFRKALANGIGKVLVNALKDLDLRIRDEAVNFYSAGNSVVRVTPAALELHYRYAAGCTFPAVQAGAYVSLPFTAAGVAAFVAELPRVRANVANYQKPEGLCEELLVQANVSNTPLIVMDRQIRLPGDADRNELDIVAVTSGPAPMLVAIELKHGLDNRIQDVPAQLQRYVRMLDPASSGLRRDVARAYRVAVRQLRALGRPAPDPAAICPGMPVRGLLVLANYNSKSQLLPRARVAARKLHVPLFLWTLRECAEPLPEPGQWSALQ